MPPGEDRDFRRIPSARHQPENAWKLSNNQNILKLNRLNLGHYHRKMDTIPAFDLVRSLR